MRPMSAKCCASGDEATEWPDAQLDTHVHCSGAPEERTSWSIGAMTASYDGS